ncbi:MAG: hypothetical protein LAP40_07260 [Acidobacteriia bacterium]|nr:hypothetical protein [Terriglobia bacterium]
MDIRSILEPRRTVLILLTGLLVIPVLSAKKSRTVLDWKTGYVWESPDACIDTWGLNRETFLIFGEDTLYHVSHRLLIGHKAGVMERSTVKYALAGGGFYLQDEAGRVFKLAVVKTEFDPNAMARINSGRQPCQPAGVAGL